VRRPYRREVDLLRTHMTADDSLIGLDQRFMPFWSQCVCRTSLSEFMERNQPALHVSLRVCGKKTKEPTFQLVKKKVGRNDDATMQTAFFGPLTMQSAKVPTIMCQENSSLVCRKD